MDENQFSAILVVPRMDETGMKSITGTREWTGPE
jgi:hypothetical protein